MTDAFVVREDGEEIVSRMKRGDWRRRRWSLLLHRHPKRTKTETRPRR